MDVRLAGSDCGRDTHLISREFSGMPKCRPLFSIEARLFFVVRRLVFAVVLVDALESYVNGDYHAMFIKKGRTQVRRDFMQGGRAPRDTGILAHDRHSIPVSLLYPPGLLLRVFLS